MAQEVRAPIWHRRRAWRWASPNAGPKGRIVRRLKPPTASIAQIDVILVCRSPCSSPCTSTYNGTLRDIAPRYSSRCTTHGRAHACST